MMQISEKSRESLKDQLNMHGHMIEQVAIKQGNYKMISDKLADLWFMSHELDISVTTDAYEKTVKNIAATIKDTISRAVKELQDQQENKNTITDEML